MAKKDKSEKKLKDKTKKSKKTESRVEEATPETVEKIVEEFTVEIEESGPVEETEAEKSVEDDSDSTESVQDSVEEAPVTKELKTPKRAAKKIEIPVTSHEFIADFPVEDILPREAKTRFRGKETEEVLSRMIQEFGWVEPLTLDAEHRIVDGQFRYELAKKWKLKTVPVIVTNGVNAKRGTTDLYHMLSGRIIEWDKWNFPATNEVLRSLDGGLKTEKVLDFETVSEAGELRDLARKIGWFIEVIPKSLSGSTVTLETLAGLLKKSLAGKYHYDPAQLLYIEALREELEETRKEMVQKGELAGGVKPKLEQHMAEEQRKQELGEKIAEENGYEMKVSEDGESATFTADAEINYIINKVAAAEEAARVQVKSARDMASRIKHMADGKKFGLTQFRILATYFTDMTAEEASDFFNRTSVEEFNEYVDSVLEENRTISADRSKNFPMTETELKAEQYRLRGEDIRKDAEKGKNSKPQGLQAMKVDDLKALLKAEGLKLTGKKDELIARLEEAGYNADGTKASGVEDSLASEPEDASELEDAMRTSPETVEVGDVRDVEVESSDLDVSSDEVESDSEETAEESQETLVPNELTDDSGQDIIETEATESAVESNSKDLKALKKRRKELKKLGDSRDLTKAELKELKALKKELKG